MNFKKVLEQIKPSKKEEQEVKDITNYILSKIKVKDAKAILGGSGAKNTWLKDSHDIDIYVKLNYKKYKDKSDQLSNFLYSAIKHLRPRRLHGSRDYFQLKHKNYTIEIVPILDIKKPQQAKNITDISQLHVDYVKKYQKRDEIRLTKAFAKAQEVYGAESYIKGFSGYVLELLTINYNSFNNLIKNVSKWSSKQIIGNKNIAKSLNKSKTQSPLILIDPVQPDRNAAAALSKEKYQKFISVCKQFLKKPSEKFFQKKKFDIKNIKKKNTIILEVIPLKGKEDIIGSKLLKTLEFIEKQLNLEGFQLKLNWHWNKKAYFWFNYKNATLPKYKIHQGPPIVSKENFQRFIEKYPNYYIKNKRVYVKLERPYTNIQDFVKIILKNKNVKNNIKSIKKI